MEADESFKFARTKENFMDLQNLTTECLNSENTKFQMLPELASPTMRMNTNLASAEPKLALKPLWDTSFMKENQ